MLNEKKNQLIQKIEFIENLEKQDIDREQVELCKKFIKFNWSNEKMSDNMRGINSYFAKEIVEHLFDKYISNEAFILAAHELKYEFELINEKNAWIKYRICYEQNT